MTRNTMLKTTLAAATLLGALSSTAHADSLTFGISQVNPSLIEVKSNGTDYTQLKTTGTVKVKGHLAYDTETGGRIKSWKIWPEIVNGVGIASKIQGLHWYAAEKHYGAGNRPKKLNTNVTMKVPATALQANAVYMCNTNADLLRNQGKSDQQIFAKNRDVYFDITLKHAIDATGPGSNSVITEYQEPKKFKVRCGKWNAPHSPGLVQAPKTSVKIKRAMTIKKATLKLQQTAALNGACKVKLTAAINTSQPNTNIKYRIVHSSGNKSNQFTTKTAANNIAVTTNLIDIPNGSGEELGWFRMEGVSANFKSNPVQYKMKCQDAGIGGYTPKKSRLKLGKKG